MLRFTPRLFAFASALLCAVAAAWGAVDIADVHVTNVGTSTFTVVWTTSDVSTPALEVFTDSGGTNAITATLGFDYYPFAEGDVSVVNDASARAGRRALEVLAINRRVVVVRVTGLSPATAYYVRPRTFGPTGADNGTAPVALQSVTTALFTSMVVDGRLLRVRFPGFSGGGTVALVQGPVGTAPLSALVGDSTDADSAVFPLAGLLDTATGTNALYDSAQQVTIRVLGTGAPVGAFTRSLSFGTSFKTAQLETVISDLATPAPVFTAHPASRADPVGATATFTATAAGTPTPTYKWQRQLAAGGAWADLGNDSTYAGTATATLTVNSVTLAMTGDQFRCVATNGLPPDAISNPATLTVSVAQIAVAITTQPQPVAVAPGQTATFTVAATGAPAPTYQWQAELTGNGMWNNLVNWGDFSGVTTATLTVSAAPLEFSGYQFRCVVSNGVSPNATSNAVLLTVAIVAPSFSAHPQPASVLVGANALFTAAATGLPAPTYRWQRQPSAGDSWSDLVNDATYAGVATATLSVNATTLAMTGDRFRCVATNGAPSGATSNAATLTVNALPVAVSITDHPRSVTVVVGRSASFAVAATGTPPPAFKWQRQPAAGGAWTDLVNGAVYAGVTTSTLTVIRTTFDMTGDQFRAVGTNGLPPDATSSAALLVVTTAPKLNQTITFAALANKVTGDAPFTLSATASSGLAPTFAIVSGPATISGSTLTLTGVGSVVVRASQAGDDRYNAAPDVSVGFYVSAGSNYPAPYTFTTLAGSGGAGLPAASEVGIFARFAQPQGVAVDSAGNVYVADTGNSIIRKIARDGMVTILAGAAASRGSADGEGSAARFDRPQGVAVDGAGNVYVADTFNHTIRKISSGGLVTTLAGTAGSQGSADATGSSARFFGPSGVAEDGAGNIYVADSGNHTIRKITSGGLVTTLAGTAGSQGANDGTGNAARFNRPASVAVDGSGNIYVADSNNHAIRQITSGGVVTTLAGTAGSAGAVDGVGSAARFHLPSGVAADGAGNVFVADMFSHTIRRIASGGTVTTVAGSRYSEGAADGTGSAAEFANPAGVAVDRTGNLYVADMTNSSIRWGALTRPVLTSVASATGTVGQPFTYAVSFSGTLAQYSASGLPPGLGFDPGSGAVSGASTIGGTFMVTLGASNGAGPASAIFTLTVATGKTPATVILGDLIAVHDGGRKRATATTIPNGLAVVITYNGSVTEPYDTGNYAVVATIDDAHFEGSASGTFVVAKASQTIAFGPLADKTYGDPPFTVSAASSRGQLLTFTIVSGPATVSGNEVTLTGAGTVVVRASQAGNSQIHAAVDVDRSFTVAPGSNYATPYTFTALAGSAGFSAPKGVAVDSVGNVYVADAANHTIRKITSGGVVTTLAGLEGSSGSADGTGSAARFIAPTGVAVDGLGNVYVANTSDATIRKITSGGVVTTLAGQAGVFGSADGTGSAARFGSPSGVAVDSAGNVFVADLTLHTIRKVTSDGVVTTLAGMSGSAGSADGTGSGARFNSPYGVAVDNAGNLYVADTENSVIRKIASGGVVTTLAGTAGSRGYTDGTGSAVRFDRPFAVATDVAGNVYVVDGNHTIRMITSGGAVTTLAGKSGNPGSTDGAGGAARFSRPSGVAVDSVGNVYIADADNHLVRWGALAPPVINTAPMEGAFGRSFTYRVTFSGALVGGYTVSGLPAGFSFNAATGEISGTPSAVGVFPITLGATNGAGTVSTTRSLFVSKANQTITFAALPNRLLGDPPFALIATADSGLAPIFSVVAGLATIDGSTVTPTGVGLVRIRASQAGNSNFSAAPDVFQNFTVSVEGNYPTPYTFSTLAGMAGSPGSAIGTGSAARFNEAPGVAVDGAGNVYVADALNHTIRKITGGGVVTTLAGTAGSSGSADGIGSSARFNRPSGVAVDSAGNLYVVDSYNHTIRKIAGGGVVTTLAGTAGGVGSDDGTGSAARFKYPFGVAVDSAGHLYITDQSNNTIRKIAPGGVVTTLAGTAGGGGSADGSGSAARFYVPAGVAVDRTGDIYVADQYNYTVRKITSGGVVTTLAGSSRISGYTDGTGSAARFNQPSGVAVDSAGNVFVSDRNNFTIRKISGEGVVTTLAGMVSTFGSANGTGSVARFNVPMGIAVDSVGNVYVADTGNHTIRWGALSPPVFSGAIAASGTVGQNFLYATTFAGVLTGYSASGVPAALNHNSATGVISGTPSSEGTFAITLGATNGAGAGTATLTLTIAHSSQKTPATVTLGNLGVVYDGTSKSATATTVPAALPVVFTYDGSSSAPTNAGSYAVVGTINDATYQGVASGTLVIAKADQTLTFAALAAKLVSDAPFTLGGTASSGLAVGYMSSNPTVASVGGSTVTLHNPGTTVLTASQPGSANFNAAPAVNQSLVVNPVAPIITSPLTVRSIAGLAFIYTIQTNLTPATFSSGPLPTGLVLNAATGVISGTPTVAGSSNVSIVAQNVTGSDTRILAITIQDPPPQITSALSASGQVGQAFTYTITAGNAPTSFAATGLPPGLLFDAGTGAISGSPTQAGTFFATIVATNAAGSGSQSLLLTIAPAPSAPVYAGSLNPGGTQGAAFNFAPAFTGNPTTFALAAGVLPAGLALSPGSGVISGHPTEVGVFPVTLRATNVGGPTDVVLQITINPAPSAPVITSASAVSTTVGAAFSFTLTASGVPAVYTFTATNRPAWLNLNPATGVLSGTPVQGTYSLPVRASNSPGAGVVQEGTESVLLITVDPSPSAPVITNTPVVAGRVGVPLNFQLTTAPAATGFAITSPAPPAWLNLNPTTGLITGTPTAAGPVRVVVAASTPTFGQGRGLEVLFDIAPALLAPVITSSGLAQGSVGQMFRYAITSMNGPFTGYAMTGTLPDGLVFNAATGVIEGVPPATLSGIAASGTPGPTRATVYLTASNAAGTSEPKQLEIVILPPENAPVMIGALDATGQVGTPFSFRLFASANGTGFMTWDLPPGLACDRSSGVITGTPTTAGTFAVRVVILDTLGTGGGQRMSQPYILTIVIVPAPGAPRITSLPAASGNVGADFTYRIVAEPGPILSYEVLPALPRGFSLNTATGVISGRPTEATTFLVNLTATNATGTSVAQLLAVSITTAAGTPVITSPMSAIATVGVPHTYTITASNLPDTRPLVPPNSLGLQPVIPPPIQSPLPPGMAINPAMGVIEGTPTLVGVYSFRLVGTNAAGAGPARELRIMVRSAAAAPVIDSAPTAAGQVGSPFNHVLTATNNPQGFGLHAVLPWLTLNPHTGVLAGTPTTPGVFIVRPMAWNSAGASDTAILAITIAPGLATPVITSTRTATGRVRTPFVYQISATPAATSYVATGLPAGLVINGATGMISGTPTASGTFPVTLQAINAAGTGAPTVLSIKIQSLLRLLPGH